MSQNVLNVLPVFIGGIGLAEILPDAHRLNGTYEKERCNVPERKFPDVNKVVGPL